jgi:hypothetical protein
VNCFTSVKKIVGAVPCHTPVMFSKDRIMSAPRRADASRLAAEAQ